MIRKCFCCGCAVSVDAATPHWQPAFCKSPLYEGSIDWRALACRPTKRTRRQAAAAVAAGSIYETDAREVLSRAGAGSYWL